MSETRKPGANPGRPSGGDGDRVRGQLLQAARELFLDNEFRAVSIRQIASAAGVNGAMVSYYFGGKQGLYLAMVDEMLLSLQQKLENLHAPGTVSLVDFSRGYCQLLADNPWWPNFLVREVLFSDGEIRAAVIHKLGTTFVPTLLQSFRQEAAAGRYRSDLDPGLTLLSLMGMTVFPFLARPVVEQVLQMQVDSDFAARLADHNTQLFLHGVQARPARGSKEET